MKQSAAAGGMPGRSSVSEQEVDTLPSSMLIKIRSSVSCIKEIKINVSVFYAFGWYKFWSLFENKVAKHCVKIT